MLHMPVSAAPSQEPAPTTQGALSQPMIHTLSLGQGDAMFLSVREVSRFLGIAKVSVYRLAERRALPVYRILRKLVFRKEDVLSWVQSLRTAGRDEDV